METTTILAALLLMLSIAAGFQMLQIVRRRTPQTSAMVATVRPVVVSEAAPEYAHNFCASQSQKAVSFWAF